MKADQMVSWLLASKSVQQNLLERRNKWFLCRFDGGQGYRLSRVQEAESPRNASGNWKSSSRKQGATRREPTSLVVSCRLSRRAPGRGFTCQLTASYAYLASEDCQDPDEKTQAAFSTAVSALFLWVRWLCRKAIDFQATMEQRQLDMQRSSATLRAMAGHVQALEAKLQESMRASEQETVEALAAKDAQIYRLER